MRETRSTPNGSGLPSHSCARRRAGWMRRDRLSQVGHPRGGPSGPMVLSEARAGRLADPAGGPCRHTGVPVEGPVSPFYRCRGLDWRSNGRRLCLLRSGQLSLRAQRHADGSPSQRVRFRDPGAAGSRPTREPTFSPCPVDAWSRGERHRRHSTGPGLAGSDMADTKSLSRRDGLLAATGGGRLSRLHGSGR